jgi:Protein of unknown function (DUF3017)
MTDPVAGPHPPGRPLRANWPFAVVCAGVLVGLGVVVLLDRFRRGTLVMAGAVLLGAWLRVLLPERQVGLLRVRGRLFDTATLLVLGVGLSVVALVVPPPS